MFCYVFDFSHGRVEADQLEWRPMLLFLWEVTAVDAKLAVNQYLKTKKKHLWRKKEKDTEKGG
jgi:hypothetical protein